MTQQPKSSAQAKPVIGITLDWALSSTFSKRPHYALRTHYFEAVEAAGGIPLGIPYADSCIDTYLNLIDGLIVPGGGMAKPKNWYLDPTATQPYQPMPRLAFDIALIEAALRHGLPVLGICEGMQVLAGMHGCTLTHNVQETFHSATDHLNARPAEERAHAITIKPGTLLEKILHTTTLEVNTAHTEGVAKAPPQVTVSATAPDGVIEAIEIPGYPFALGVQWHPEFFVAPTDPDRNIFTALLAAAQAAQSTTNQATQ